MLRSKIPPLHLARLGKRTQYVLAETMTLLFGLAACQVFQSAHGYVLWSAIVPCLLGYLAAFSLVLTTRCDNCNEPVGREGKRLIAMPHTHCTRCGTSLG